MITMMAMTMEMPNKNHIYDVHMKVAMMSHIAPLTLHSQLRRMYFEEKLVLTRISNSTLENS